MARMAQLGNSTWLKRPVCKRSSGRGHAVDGAPPIVGIFWCRRRVTSRQSTTGKNDIIATRESGHGKNEALL
jgi:hypothetical protein